MRQFQNLLSEVICFFSFLFFIIFLFYPFLPHTPVSLPLYTKHWIPWNGRPTSLQGLRDQSDILSSDYFSLIKKRMPGSFYQDVMLLCTAMIRESRYDIVLIGSELWETRFLTCFFKMQQNKNSSTTDLYTFKERKLCLISMLLKNSYYSITQTLRSTHWVSQNQCIFGIYSSDHISSTIHN